MLIRILPVWYFVHRAPNTFRSLVSDVGVNDGCSHMLVSQEFLHCSNIVTILQEVGRKGMTERVTARPQGRAGSLSQNGILPSVSGTMPYTRFDNKTRSVSC